MCESAHVTARPEPAGAGLSAGCVGVDVEAFFALVRRLVHQEPLDGSGLERLTDRVRDLPGSALVSNIDASLVARMITGPKVTMSDGGSEAKCSAFVIVHPLA